MQSLGAGPCHVLVNRKLGYALISNYVGGSFKIQSIDKETGEFDLKYSKVMEYGKGDFCCYKDYHSDKTFLTQVGQIISN